MAADATTRTETFPSGIVRVGLGEVERQVPVDEPSPPPPNALLAVIGKPVPRQNGRAKVTGATTFTVDVTLQGMLHGRILRAEGSSAFYPSRASIGNLYVGTAQAFPLRTADAN